VKAEPVGAVNGFADDQRYRLFMWCGSAQLGALDAPSQSTGVPGWPVFSSH